MRTSLDLPNDTFRKLKARAAAEGKTIKTLVQEIITAALNAPTHPSPQAPSETTKPKATNSLRETN
jgi:plasmid stability protein